MFYIWFLFSFNAAEFAGITVHRDGIAEQSLNEAEIYVFLYVCVPIVWQEKAV